MPISLLPLSARISKRETCGVHTHGIARLATFKAGSREGREKQKIKEQESKESNVCSCAEFVSFVLFVNIYLVYTTHDSVADREFATLKFPKSTRAFCPFLFRYLRPKTLAALAAGRRTVCRDSRGIIFSIISRSTRDTRAL